jgi:flagellin
MASYINTNMASLNTQNNLTKSQGALNQSIQRLSSGMRVNGAKDDAAGMAIASRMDSVIKGQNVAVRNANDAISFSQTAEGAMTKIADNLQRMRELAVQSANGTNGSDDRESLNTEFKQLQDEINRVSSNTKFNGISVLNGASQTFQIGSGTTASDKIEISGADLTAASSDTGKAKDQTSDAELTTFKAAKDAFIAAGGTIDSTTNTGSGGTAPTAAANTAKATYDTAKTAYDAAKTTYDASAKDAAATTAFATAQGTFNTAKTNFTTGGGFVDSNNFATAASPLADYKKAQSTFEATGVNITDQSSATKAIDQIDKALKEVNTETIKQGANQNRFAAVISTLQVSVENQTTARSRIMDTDYASETATMARGQILQQAGMAMLAQANQLPNGVMALMRG